MTALLANGDAGVARFYEHPSNGATARAFDTRHIYQPDGSAPRLALRSSVAHHTQSYPFLADRDCLQSLRCARLTRLSYQTFIFFLYFFFAYLYHEWSLRPEANTTRWSRAQNIYAANVGRRTKTPPPARGRQGRPGAPGGPSTPSHARQHVTRPFLEE